MDGEQEGMKSLGVFAIYEEACSIIMSWTKIFTKITLALIFPLVLIFLAHIQVSDVLFAKIINNEETLDETRVGTQRYQKLSDILSSEWTTYWLVKSAYFTFFIAFFLLSISTIVYTIACIYTGKEVTFRNIMSVVPRVWRRLMVTFFCIIFAFLAYSTIALLVLIIWGLTIGSSNLWGMAILVVLVSFYIMGLVYMGIIWCLACVISVMEDAHGVSALLKSKELLRGKMVVASIIFVNIGFLFCIIQLAFERLAVNGESMNMVSRVAYGTLCFLLLVQLMLFGLIVQTVIYFVCKSYHHESIDKLALADHLQVYLGDYVPLKEKDVQLQQLHV